jgi:NRPS condensation-like uncharacterized protein
MKVNQASINIKREATAVERFFTRSPFSIVTMVARIKGNVTKEMLKNAVEQVQRQHFLLRVRIEDDQDHKQWFTSQGVQDIPIEIVPRDAEDDWIKIHADALEIPFEFETRPAIRFILVQSTNVSELIILCHHMICDGMSLAYLARDVMIRLGEPGLKVETHVAPPVMDLDNLPADVSQSGLAQFFIKRMNQQWVEEREFFDQEDYEVLTQTYWDHYHHKFFSIELSEAETSALVNRCRAENVSVNSALTAAFTGAQSFVTGKKPFHSKIVVAASLRDRLPISPGEGMGMYAGSVELKFTYKYRRSFWENARLFHRTIQPKLKNRNLFGDILNWLYLEPAIFEAMNFKKLGGLVSAGSASHEKLSAYNKKADIVLRILQRDNLESMETKHWGTAITNLGRLDFPKKYGSLELDRLIMQPGGGIPLANVNMVLGAVTCSGKLSLVVEYAEEAVDTKTIEKINNVALEYLFNQ